MSVAIPKAPASRPLSSKPRALAQPRPAGSGPSSQPASSSGPLQSGSFVAAALARKATAASNAKASSSKSASSPAATTPPSNTPVAAMQPGKDTSSSAGKIFAKPSKEWVLPERAKPGRKVSVEEPDDKRQSQNRLSQRAHRARKTDYIQTLEERLRQYEADEIHSNVRLQEVARALKADHERLKVELAISQAKEQEAERARERSVLSESRRNSQVEVEDAWKRERRWMEGEIRRLQAEVAGLKVLLTRGERPSSTSYQAEQPPAKSASSSSAGHGSRQAPLACPICPDPDPDCPCQQPGGRASAMTESTISAAVYAQSPLTHGIDRGPAHSSCGLCTNEAECLCRIVDQKPQFTHQVHGHDMAESTDSCGLCTSTDVCACRVEPAAAAPLRSTRMTTAVPVSGIEAAPIGGAVLLRKRTSATGRPKANIWALDNPLPAQGAIGRRMDAVCTGDPSNCDACKDDRFGQEFCGHLFNDPHPAPAKPCPTCPGNCMSINSILNKPASGPGRSQHYPQHLNMDEDEDDEMLPRMQEPLIMACCGQPELCGHGGGCVGEVVGLGRIEEDMAAEAAALQDRSTMRPDQAWRELKAHPNAKFASLALLADVVARRTICNTSGGEGGSGWSSPAPLPRDSSAPTSPSTRAVNAAVHDHHGTKGRLINIDTGAVREALRILDETEPGEKRAAEESPDGVYGQRKKGRRA